MYRRKEENGNRLYRDASKLNVPDGCSTYQTSSYNTNNAITLAQRHIKDDPSAKRVELALDVAPAALLAAAAALKALVDVGRHSDSTADVALAMHPDRYDDIAMDVQVLADAEADEALDCEAFCEVKVGLGVGEVLKVVGRPGEVVGLVFPLPGEVVGLVLSKPPPPFAVKTKRNDQTWT